ncbi:hypothetical protein A2Z22_04555 [Candidatus Woesebacteria bacterium RBG_16_34_12]|uniref:Transposase IS200-like domain-containing protein n=1 Tax=Candidatus Woesebacteria bacterium RBG_16_34_12 TaxID=1802480 RepID=A0A1F7XBM5_9BACT|nr:MAG: hypothetical protein A2Z22_04555 [Candidatus Woesebacteria bacterium RBG_16_34_12]
MPSKNRQKIYIENGIYHIYNRGVAKLPIFLDTQDYIKFINILNDALTKRPLKIISFDLRGRSYKAVEKQIKNFLDEISLIAYCLMKNHFHLLIKQNSKNSMESFMRSILTRYSSYFNKKYKRVGPVFQGRYKAILITKENYLLHLSRYIHLNPQEENVNLLKAFSSYSNYLGLRKNKWLKPKIILDYFKREYLDEMKFYKSYQNFVEVYKGKKKRFLKNMILE